MPRESEALVQSAARMGKMAGGLICRDHLILKDRVDHLFLGKGLGLVQYESWNQKSEVRLLVDLLCPE